MAKAKKRTSWRFPLALTLLVILLLYACWSFFRPGPLTQETTFLLKKGTSVYQAINAMHDQGIIRNKTLFKIWARLGKLKFMRGEYIFPPKISMSNVGKKLGKGEIHFVKLIIPPAIHAWSLQKKLEPFIPADAFWELWESPQLASIAGFPDAPCLEGLIAPATYSLNRAMEPEEIMQQMVEVFHAQIFHSLEDGVLPPYQTLILASLAEKETNMEKELPHITGVFYNRLNKPMRLQCDPTSLYARWVSGDLRFTAPTREDTSRIHPYNTYSTSGLPPSPIAIPSKAAIEAAKAPMKTDDYYFVATGKGGHNFSRTLSEHNRFVNSYRTELNRQRRPTKQKTTKTAKPQAKKPTPKKR